VNKFLAVVFDLPVNPHIFSSAEMEEGKEEEEEEK